MLTWCVCVFVVLVVDVVDFAIAGASAKSVAILKLPRSGSSWFVSLLSQQPGVWIVPQVLRPNDDNETAAVAANGNDAHDIELLMSALAQPFKARDDPLAAATEQRVIGFSLNPLKYANESRFDNGKALRNAVSKRDAFVVLFERTNLVKQAIATMRGSCLKAQCHFNNVLVNQSKWPKSHVLLNGLNSDKDFQACSLAASHTVPLRDLQCTLVWHSVARETLRQLQRSAARDDRRLYVAYEALQHNTSGVIERLFQPDQLGPLEKPIVLEQFFAKTTGENLKESIANYGEVFKLFEEARSACLLEMLQVDHARVFNTTECEIPKAWHKVCRNWIPAAKPLIADKCVLH
jgi:hypothetical protein